MLERPVWRGSSQSPPVPYVRPAGIPVPAVIEKRLPFARALAWNNGRLFRAQGRFRKLLRARKAIRDRELPMVRPRCVFSAGANRGRQSIPKILETVGVRLLPDSGSSISLY